MKEHDNLRVKRFTRSQNNHSQKAKNGNLMLSQKTYRIWRAINVAIIITGLMMTWAEETMPSSGPVTALAKIWAHEHYPVFGWKYLAERFLYVFHWSYDGYLLKALVQSLIYDFVFVIYIVLLIYYLVFNMISIINVKFASGLLQISFFLGGIAAFFPYLLHIYDDYFTEPYFGFQVFSFGLISSFILEWSPDFLLDTIKEVDFSRKAYKIWRLVNMAIISAGLLMIWEDISFEEYPALVTGWQYLARGFFSYWPYPYFNLEDIVFETIYFFPLKFFDALLIYYLTFNLASIKDDKLSEYLEKVSLVLCGGTLLLFFSLFVFAFSFSQVYPFGFLIFVLGIWSSAILEWKQKYPDDPVRSFFRFETIGDMMRSQNTYRVWRIFNIFVIAAGLLMGCRYGDIPRGFIYFVFGIWSSAILEWKRKNPDNPTWNIFSFEIISDMMCSQKTYKAWRVFNMFVIAAGLLMDLGYVHIPHNWMDNWNNLFDGLRQAPWAMYEQIKFLRLGYLTSRPTSLLVILCIVDALLIYYLVFNLYSIVKERSVGGLKIMSLILCGGVLILSVYLPVKIGSFFSGEFYFGLVIFVLGTWSAAILEWSPKLFDDKVIHSS